jgi:hypothetical protein
MNFSSIQAIKSFLWIKYNRNPEVYFTGAEIKHFAEQRLRHCFLIANIVK